MTAARRPKPTRPYVPTRQVCTFAPAMLDLLAQVAAGYRGERLEWCALLYGSRSDNGSTVEAVIVPSQDNHWGYYDVSASAMAEASRAAGDLLLVGQVHAHPGEDVEHSPVDDRKAASVKILSFVVPFYGRKLPSIDGVGVHEHQDGYWHLLTASASQHRVAIASGAPNPTFTDLR